MRAQFDDITLDTSAGTVTIGGERVHLTPRLLATLEALVGQHDRVVSREQLMAAVWRDTHVDANSVSQAIKGLRRALGASTGVHRIRAVPKRGYVLAGPVTILTHPPDGLALSEPSRTRPESRPGGRTLRSFMNSSGWLAVAAAFCLAAAYNSLLTGTGQAGRPPDESVRFHETGAALLASRRAPDLQRAAELFARAVDADPGNYDALVALAQAQYLLGFYGIENPRTAARAAARTTSAAIDLRPRRAAAYAVRASIVLDTEWDLTASARDFAQAVRLDPDNPLVHHWSAWWCLAAGRMPEARAALDRAVRLDPYSASALVARATFAYLDRDLDSAIADATRALQLDPRFFRAHLRLGLAHLMTGDGPGAIRRLTTAYEMAPGIPETAAALAHAYAVSGDAESAHRLLLKHDAQLTSYDRAIVLSGLGRYRDALDSLARARRETQLVPGLFAYEPRLASLHRFAEFRELQSGSAPLFSLSLPVWK